MQTAPIRTQRNLEPNTHPMPDGEAPQPHLTDVHLSAPGWRYVHGCPWSKILLSRTKRINNAVKCTLFVSLQMTRTPQDLCLKVHSQVWAQKSRIARVWNMAPCVSHGCDILRLDVSKIKTEILCSMLIHTTNKRIHLKHFTHRCTRSC